MFIFGHVGIGLKLAQPWSRGLSFRTLAIGTSARVVGGHTDAGAHGNFPAAASGHELDSTIPRGRSAEPRCSNSPRSRCFQ